MMDFLFLPSWVVLLLIVAILTFVYHHFTSDNRRKFGLPGPTPKPLLGVFWDVMKKGMLDFDVHLVKTYGRKVALSSGIMDNAMGDLVITDVNMLKEIMVKQANIFSDRHPFTSVSPLDKSVLMSTGDRWKQMRSTITPTFSTGKLRHMEGMVSKCADTMVENLRKKAKAGEKFDDKIWGCYTMDVICATAFGVEVDSLNNPKHPFVVQAADISDAEFNNPVLLLLLFLCPRLVRFLEPIFMYIPVFRNFAAPIKYFGKITEDLLKDRKQAQEGHHNDFLQLMLDAHNMATSELGDDEREVGKWKKKALTTEEIAGNGMVFFFAGYGTTNDTLTFTSYLLATHPEIQERLVQEIDSVLQGDQPTNDNVTRLTYLEQVINESMRMYPVGIRVDRVATQDTTVNGLFIPKDTTIAIPLYAIHRDPEYYPDPDQFDPDRFTPEAKAKRNPYTFLPFGMGPRNCIGMRLALLEMKMVLVKILQNFTFATCADTPIPLVLSKEKPLKPASPVWLKLEERSV